MAFLYLFVLRSGADLGKHDGVRIWRRFDQFDVARDNAFDHGLQEKRGVVAVFGVRGHAADRWDGHEFGEQCNHRPVVDVVVVVAAATVIFLGTKAAIEGPVSRACV